MIANDKPHKLPNACNTAPKSDADNSVANNKYTNAIINTIPTYIHMMCLMCKDIIIL